MSQTFKSVSPSPASCPYTGTLGCLEEVGRKRGPRAEGALSTRAVGFWSCQRDWKLWKSHFGPALGHCKESWPVTTGSRLPNVEMDWLPCFEVTLRGGPLSFAVRGRIPSPHSSLHPWLLQIARTQPGLRPRLPSSEPTAQPVFERDFPNF